MCEQNVVVPFLGDLAHLKSITTTPYEQRVRAVRVDELAWCVQNVNYKSLRNTATRRLSLDGRRRVLRVFYFARACPQQSKQPHTTLYGGWSRVPELECGMFYAHY